MTNKEMMDKEMIDKIYKVIAYKTLSFGCKLLRTSKDQSQKIYYTLEPTPFGKIHISSIPFWDMIIEIDPDWISKGSWDEYKVIWHPVMIGDVLDWVYHNKEKWKSVLEIFNNLSRRRTYMRKPIEDQDSECILFIYNLINDPTRENDIS